MEEVCLRMSFTLPFDLICRCNRFLQITLVQTDFQMIDIYDVLTPERGTHESYEKSLASNGLYESSTARRFSHRYWSLQQEVG
jgi:hypothetical protein